MDVLQVARSGENEEQANTNSPPPLLPPLPLHLVFLAAGPRWEGLRVARRAGCGVLVAGAVSWMGGWVAYSNEVYCRRLILKWCNQRFLNL